MHRKVSFRVGTAFGIGVLLLAFTATSAAHNAVKQRPAVTTIKLGHALGVSHPQHLGAVRFAQLVKKKTNGQFQINVFPDAQLGDDIALQEQVALGALELAIPGNTLQLAPRTGVFWLPYMFRTKEQRRYVIGGKIGKEVFRDLLAKGIRTLAVFDGDYNALINKQRPIRIMSDLRGLKIRTSSTGLNLAMWRAFGAVPVGIAFAEAYTALQQGIIDGIDNSLLTIYSAKYYELAKYVAITRHRSVTQPLVVSNAFWNTLDAKTRKAFQEAATEAQAYNYNQVDAANKTIIADLKAKGVQFTSPYPAPFRDRSLETYPIFTATYGTDIVARIQDVKCVRKRGVIRCSD